MRLEPKWIALAVVVIISKTYYQSNQIVAKYQDTVPNLIIENRDTVQDHILENQDTVQDPIIENQDNACPRDYFHFPDVYGDKGDGSAGTRNEPGEQLIPKVFYQTGKSRCIHPDIAEIMTKWRDLNAFPGFSYFFYDDEAMDAFLFDKARWEDIFPSLHLALQCIDEVHNPTMKADIWRYLVLWEYGGIYVDIDTAPKGFTALTIQPDDDGLLYLQGGGFMAQFFLVITPRHPLMFYSVHAAVQGVLGSLELSTLDPAKSTGPRALANGMAAFMNNATAGRHMNDGTYVGKDGRSIRVDGHYKYQVQNVMEFIPKKRRIYKEMNMTHYHDLRVSQHKGSCYNMMNATETQTGFVYEGAKVELLEMPTQLQILLI